MVLVLVLVLVLILTVRGTTDPGGKKPLRRLATAIVRLRNAPQFCKRISLTFSKIIRAGQSQSNNQAHPPPPDRR